MIVRGARAASDVRSVSLISQDDGRDGTHKE
jgi:hypothetical protein